MNKKVDLLVVGGGAAGMSIAAAAKRAQPEWNITVIEAGEWISFGACGIPYCIDGRVKSIDDLVVLTPEDAQKKKGVNALVKHIVEDVDVNAHRALVHDIKGDRTLVFEYEKLAIATGAKPIIPSIQGANSEGVFSIRSLYDAIKIRRFIEENSPKEAVIIGAGFVGMEMAESLTMLGIKVTVIELLPTVLGLYDSQMRDAVISEGKDNGVDFKLEERVSAIETKNGKVSAVHTDKGDYKADIVIMSVGIRPNVELARKIGLELGAGGAIYVDLKGATSRPNIFAAGDCAQIRDLITGNWIWVPLGTTANRQGRAIGYTIAGKSTPFRGIVRSAVTKFFTLGIQVVGMPKEEGTKLGWKLVETTIKSSSHTHYYPGAKTSWTHLYADATTLRILGGQYVGPAESVKRFDVVVAAVSNRMTAEDLAYMNIPYAPPVGTVWDPINIAASKLIKS